jgi:hypothetical protein
MQWKRRTVGNKWTDSLLSCERLPSLSKYYLLTRLLLVAVCGRQTCPRLIARLATPTVIDSATLAGRPAFPKWGRWYLECPMVSRDTMTLGDWLRWKSQDKLEAGDGLSLLSVCAHCSPGIDFMLSVYAHCSPAYLRVCRYHPTAHSSVSCA